MRTSKIFQKHLSKRKTDSSLFLLLSPNNITPIDGSCYKIIDSSILQEPFQPFQMLIMNESQKKNHVSLEKVTNKNRYNSYPYNVITLNQNQNESINSTVRSRFPKGFCRTHNFTISICDTVP